MAIAGHVSPEMLEHYSHIRQEAKRKAVESFDNVTITAQLENWKRRAEQQEPAQVRRKGKGLVGAIGFEPTPPAPKATAKNLSRWFV